MLNEFTRQKFCLPTILHKRNFPTLGVLLKNFPYIFMFSNVNFMLTEALNIRHLQIYCLTFVRKEKRIGQNIKE